MHIFTSTFFQRERRGALVSNTVVRSLAERWSGTDNKGAWAMNEEVLKELREIRYSVRGGVYFIGAVLMLGFAALYWK